MLLGVGCGVREVVCYAVATTVRLASEKNVILARCLLSNPPGLCCVIFLVDFLDPARLFTLQSKRLLSLLFLPNVRLNYSRRDYTVLLYPIRPYKVFKPPISHSFPSVRLRSDMMFGRFFFYFYLNVFCSVLVLTFGSRII